MVDAYFKFKYVTECVIPLILLVIVCGFWIVIIFINYMKSWFEHHNEWKDDNDNE